MLKGMFYNTRIPLETFKRIFVFFSKNRLFSKGYVHGFWSKKTKFVSEYFSIVYVHKDLGVS